MNRILLHIGLPKTATSSLQQYLATNRRLLQTQGCLYPSSCEWHDKSHHKLYFALREFTASSGDLNNHPVILDLTKEIQASNCSECIISSELFANRPSQDFLDGILNPSGTGAKQVYVLTSFRNLSDLYLSNFFQRIKDPGVALSLSLSQWIKAGLVILELENSLRWSLLCNRQSRHNFWFRYEIQKFNNKVPFLKYFSKRYKIKDKRVPHRNPSLSLSRLMVLHHLNMKKNLTLSQNEKIRQILPQREFVDMVKIDTRLDEIDKQNCNLLSLEQCSAIKQQLSDSPFNEILQLILDRQSYRELARKRQSGTSYDQLFLENSREIETVSTRLLSSVDNI